MSSPTTSPVVSVDWATACIYFIEAKGGDAVKIGKTLDLKTRIRELQTSNHCELEVLARPNLPQAVEKMLHDFLAEHHIRGEWFKKCDAVLAVIEAAKKGDDALYDHIGCSVAQRAMLKTFRPRAFVKNVRSYPATR